MPMPFKMGSSPTSSPPTTPFSDAQGRLPRLRQFSGWVSRVGVVRVTLLLCLLSSVCSFGFTWFLLQFGESPKMGSAAWISLLVPIPLVMVFGGICIFLVASLERAWGQIHELAMLDALTGLNNRTHFMPAAQRELDLALRHNQPLALIVLDVDHFKSINDSIGHLGGDDVLIQVAQRCRNALRTTDLLARWGGEEFIMLLPNTPLQQARQLAERVRESLRATPSIMVSGQPIVVTASMGGAGVIPGRTTKLEQLIRSADTALYLAKSAGRDRVTMSEDHPLVPADLLVHTPADFASQTRH